MAIAVLTASYRMDLDRLRELIGEEAMLAAMMEFQDVFPGWEVGSMPPLDVSVL